MQREHLPCFARCSLRVHRLSSINVLFCAHVHMCVSQCMPTSAGPLDDSHEKKSLNFFFNPSTDKSDEYNVLS